MNIQEWFTQHVWNADKLVAFGGAVLKIIFVFIAARVFLYFANIAVEKMFKLRLKGPLRQSERRETTLVKLCQNIVTYATYFIAIITAIEALGINIAALLAGVSIAGLAIGFGAQNLVRDIVTGFFIIFEDQFSVGDHVKINDVGGTVEELGLRTTRLKALDGEIYFFPNSSITKVANYTLGGKELEKDSAAPATSATPTSSPAQSAAAQAPIKPLESLEKGTEASQKGNDVVEKQGEVSMKEGESLTKQGGGAS